MASPATSDQADVGPVAQQRAVGRAVPRDPPRRRRSAGSVSGRPNAAEREQADAETASATNTPRHEVQRSSSPPSVGASTGATPITSNSRENIFAAAGRRTGPAPRPWRPPPRPPRPTPCSTRSAPSTAMFGATTHEHRGDDVQGHAGEERPAAAERVRQRTDQQLAEGEADQRAGQRQLHRRRVVAAPAGSWAARAGTCRWSADRSRRTRRARGPGGRCSSGGGVASGATRSGRSATAGHEVPSGRRRRASGRRWPSPSAAIPPRPSAIPSLRERSWKRSVSAALAHAPGRAVRGQQVEERPRRRTPPGRARPRPTTRRWPAVPGRRPG